MRQTKTACFPGPSVSLGGGGGDYSDQAFWISGDQFSPDYDNPAVNETVYFTNGNSYKSSKFESSDKAWGSLLLPTNVPAAQVDFSASLQVYWATCSNQTETPNLVDWTVGHFLSDDGDSLNTAPSFPAAYSDANLGASILHITPAFAFTFAGTYTPGAMVSICVNRQSGNAEDLLAPAWLLGVRYSLRTTLS